MGDQYDPYAYLQTFDGDTTYYLKHKDERKGQRFFNSLNENDRWILKGSAFDPYYSDSAEVVRNAVKHLVNFGS